MVTAGLETIPAAIGHEARSNLEGSAAPHRARPETEETSNHAPSIHHDKVTKHTCIVDEVAVNNQSMHVKSMSHGDVVTFYI